MIKKYITKVWKIILLHCFIQTFRINFSYSIELRLQSVDFEENTITLKLPDDFWDKHEVGCGNVTIILGDSIRKQEEK